MSSLASSEPYATGDEIPGTRCTFERALGEGGYGTVLLCRHVVLQRRVVLKLLLMSHCGRDDLALRMLAEARALAQLDHPNIALIHDAGMTGEVAPRPFLTLQYYPGETLAQALAAMPGGGGIGLLPTLDLGIELCDGLRAAHERGIVHRDVKPANVYLARTPEGRTVTKVIDFGIAHFKEATTRATGKLYLGTPRYSAPEQIQGLPPTAHTDLYAVGLVLYDCLCGRGPFDPADGHLDANEMMRAHLQEKPTPVSALASDVPEELETLIAELVAKQPDARPLAASSVAARLREIRARLQGARSAVQAADDPNRTEPTPFDNRQIRYSANTGENAHPAPAEPEEAKEAAEAAQSKGTTQPVAPPPVGPAGTVLVTQIVVVGDPEAPSVATSEPLDRGAVTRSAVPEAERGSSPETEDHDGGLTDDVALDPVHEVSEATQQPPSPQTLSDAPVVASQAPPPSSVSPSSGSRLRARVAVALGGAMMAAALSAGIWHLRHPPGSSATSVLVGSPVGSAFMAASFASPAQRTAAPAAAASSSGPAPSGRRMLAAPAETTSPAASGAKPLASASASSSARSQTAPESPAAGTRSRATAKQKADPLSELKHTISASPGPLERPGVTF